MNHLELRTHRRCAPIFFFPKRGKPKIGKSTLCSSREWQNMKQPHPYNGKKKCPYWLSVPDPHPYNTQKMSSPIGLTLAQSIRRHAEFFL